MRDISVKLFEFGPVFQEEMSIKRYFLSRDLKALLFSAAEPFAQFL